MRRWQELEDGRGLGASIAPVLLLPFFLIGLAGCNGDQVAAYQPVTDPTQLYMSLTLNHKAITLAAGMPPYDTLQLIATPRDAAGVPFPGLGAPTFHLALDGDSTALQVDSITGVLTARQPREGIKVIAELPAPGNIRHADTALVNVTSDVPPSPLATLTIEIAAGDSAIWSILPPAINSGDSLSPFSLYTLFFSGVFRNPTLASLVYPRDASGTPLEGVAVEYRSLAPTVASFDDPWDNQVQLHQAGQAPFVVEATAYGVTRADTVTFTVTPPSFVPITLQVPPGGPSSGTLFGAERTLRSWGVVLWLNSLGRPVDIVFDDPTNVLPAPAGFCDAARRVLSFLAGYSGPGSYCTGGNLTLAAPAAATAAEIWKTVQLQQFTQPGTYTYHDALTGAAGRIVVTAGPSSN